VKCRHCGSALELVLADLGAAPPSNAYLAPAALSAPETHYPLRVLVCERCWLAQTEDFAAAETLFTADYAYFSSYSESWLAHARAFAAEAIDRFELRGGRVAEIAANDGYLLQYFQDAGVECYGIEPARAAAEQARSRGLDIVEEFFGESLGRALAAENRQADLAVANNVLAHVPDINDFVAGFARLLKPRGVASFEFPHLVRLVERAQFDTIYHEHYSYLSLTAVDRVLAAAGLEVFDVVSLPTHGGSLRVLAQRRGEGGRPRADSVDATLAAEARAGVKGAEFYRGFQPRIEAIKNAFLDYLLAARRAGLSVAGYGAAAKGNTLLNFAGVKPDLMPYVVDRNPAKQGKYLPGSRIPIRDEAALKAGRPDRIVIFPWNLEEEIVAQLGYVGAWGGRFALAAPSLRERDPAAS